MGCFSLEVRWHLSDRSSQESNEWEKQDEVKTRKSQRLAYKPQLEVLVSTLKLLPQLLSCNEYMKVDDIVTQGKQDFYKKTYQCSPLRLKDFAFDMYS